MPYTIEEKKLARALRRKYGKRWKEVYHAMETLAAKGEKFVKIFGKRSKLRRRKKFKNIVHLLTS